MAEKFKKLVIIAIMQVVFIVKTLFFIPHGICKYNPSCTSYMEEALMKLPIYKAVFKIIYRLLRCNPFSKGGYDPIFRVKIGCRRIK